ncbi:murein hydrolase activator EnvC family protein [Pinibacter aurantiacus]|uniref:Peptidoglycan DD-metalloendopeptidase family protein n=1 Tax=Pinibacter aurantiacus TaxID=2851599 RepID=A0A9E2W7F7_9BACT|nr:peptidoglycan DD-metalloendopeptidase family protein [Pinibacter aurantiacus]MBV4356596.1 peptidoglycan DD-metalloendopeptidase family protein [Pinibacter aurantiacus]
MNKIFLLYFLTLFTVNCFAQTPRSAELKRKRAAIQQEIDALRRSIDETKKDKKESLGQLALIQKKLRLRQQQIDIVNEQISDIQGDIDLNAKEVDKLRNELDTLRQQYETSVVYAYKNRSNYNFLNFLFSSTSFNDALKRFAYLKAYRAYRQQQVENYLNTQTQLQLKLSDLKDSKKERNEALREQTKQQAVLVEDKKEQDEVVTKLKSREQELTKRINEKRKQDIALRNAINAAIRREIAIARAKALEEEKAARKKAAAEKKALAAANKKKKGSKVNKEKADPVTLASSKPAKAESPLDDRPETRAMSANFERNRGHLPWPMASGSVIMHFGPQFYPNSKARFDNYGITIETRAGTSVKAVFNGEVSAIMSIGPSEAVIIKHGRYFTTYSNLSGVSVSKGDVVKMGQVLGKLDDKGDNLGELEFLISNDKMVNLDPEKWLR